MNEIFIYFREKSQTLTKMNTSNRVKRDQGQVKTYKIQNKCLKNIMAELSKQLTRKSSP